MSDAARDKHVSAKAAYGFNLVGLEDGETILTATAAVSPAGLTIAASVVITGSRFTVFVSGGTAGVDYTIRFHIKTSLDYEDDFDYLIKVIA